MGSVVTATAFAAGSSNEIIVGGLTNGRSIDGVIEKSTDGGNAWTVVNLNGVPSAIGIDHLGSIICATNLGAIEKADSSIYVAGPHVGTSGKPDGWQIQKSNDGKNWTIVDEFQSAGASAIVSVDPKGILIELGVGANAFNWVVRGFGAITP